MDLSGFPAHVETQTIDWSSGAMAHMGTTVDYVFTGWDQARVLIGAEELHDVRYIKYDYTRLAPATYDRETVAGHQQALDSWWDQRFSGRARR